MTPAIPRRLLLLFCFLVLSFTCRAQYQPDRYSQILMALPTAEDKLPLAKELAAETSKNYTPANIEYFSGFFSAGFYIYNVDPRLAIKYYETAIDAYMKNYTSYTVLNDDANISQAFQSLSSAYISIGLISTAIQVLETNRPFFDKASNNSRATIYNTLGDLYLTTGDERKAMERFSVVKKILDSGAPMMLPAKKGEPKWQKNFRETMEPIHKNTRTMMYAMSLGNYYFGRHQYDSAVLYMRQSNAIVRDFTEQNKQTAHTSKFVKMLMPDTMKTMMNENQRYMEIQEQMSGINMQLVIALAKSGHKDEAKTTATTLADKAVYHHLVGELDESERLYKDLLAKANDFGNWRYYKWAQKHWTNTLLAQYNILQCAKKNFTEAHQQYKKEIDESNKALQRDFAYFSENEKREYFTAYSTKLHRLYSVLLNMGETNPEAQFEVLNRSLQTKGLILEATKQQQSRIKAITDPALMADVERIKAYREKITIFSEMGTKSSVPVEDSIRHYTLAINNLQKKINDKAGATPVLISDVSWKTLQKNLKPADAYVEIIKVNREQFNYDAPVSQYWAFVVRQTGNPVSMLIGQGEGFEKSMKNYQNKVKFQMDDPDSYDKFWKKIAEKLSGIKKIYFNGDGIYHVINPLALKNTATNRFVVEELDIARVSTGRDIMKTVPPLPAGTAVLIGNPNFTMSRKSAASKVETRAVDAGMFTGMRAGFSMLPGTEKEVDFISSFASSKGKNVTVLKGNDANELNVKKLSDPAILHFATHGMFDSYGKGDSYLKSKLILAGAADEQTFTYEDYRQYEDGYLTAYEVTQLDLDKTALVVLSACETGLGDIQGGEGVWGLQRAFQVAGSSSVMGSLWKISDEATASFMEAFYKSYCNGGAVHASYLTAMNETKKLYPHPYFWGAFVLLE
jgi:CHAT domain-containing protein